MANWTVTLEVRETRILAIELIDVEATDERSAIDIARQTYKDTGRREFEVCVEDVENNEIIEATARRPGSRPR